MKRIFDYAVGNALIYTLVAFTAWTWVLGCSVYLWKVITVAILHSVLTTVQWFICETMQKMREADKEATK